MLFWKPCSRLSALFQQNRLEISRRACILKTFTMKKDVRWFRSDAGTLSIIAVCQVIQVVHLIYDYWQAPEHLLPQLSRVLLAYQCEEPGFLKKIIFYTEDAGLIIRARENSSGAPFRSLFGELLSLAWKTSPVFSSRTGEDRGLFFAPVHEEEISVPPVCSGRNRKKGFGKCNAFLRKLAFPEKDPVEDIQPSTLIQS